jgi:hypothetical protein
MSLGVPVFNLKGLKRSYYYFLSFNLICTIGALLLNLVFKSLIDHSFFNRINSWILFFILLAGAFLTSYVDKKEYKTIMDTAEIEERFAAYEKYYKRKMLWNAITFAITAILYVGTGKNIFVYILLIQLVMSVMFYPGKKFMSTILHDQDAVTI